MIYPRDNVIYDELFNEEVAAARVKGQVEVIQDVFGFWFTDVAAGAEGTFIYRMRQVVADKAQGTGEAILAGDRVYYIVATGLVSATAVGVAGTDSYFCGWAKRDATAAQAQVWMNFDGTRYDEAI